MEPATRNDSPLADAGRGLLLIWGLELLLARFSGGTQDPVDVAKSLVGLLVIALVVPFAVQLLLPRSLKPYVWAGASAVALWLVSWGILATPLTKSSPLIAMVALAAGVLVLFAFLAVRSSRGGASAAGAGLITAVVSGAALLAWLLMRGSLPPLSILAPFAVAAVAAMLLAWNSWVSMVLLLAVPVVAVWPDSPPSPKWHNDAPAAEGPDIVLLCVDTLRFDAAQSLVAYQRMTIKGTTCAAAQAGGPWTMPSMASVMTGQHVYAHGAGTLPGGVPVGLAAETPTLAEDLAAAGYDTAAVVNNAVLGKAYGFDRGFAHYDHASDEAYWSLPRTRKTAESRPIVAHLLGMLRWAGRRTHYDSAYLANAAVRILEERREQPLFLWVHFLDCHFPFRRAHQLRVPYSKKMTLERGDSSVYRDDPFWSTGEGIELLRRGYENELEAVDTALQRILDALGPPPERGRIVVLFSDHGEEFFEHGGVEHGHAFWQELLAVPMVFTGVQGLEPQTLLTTPVTHADLAATLRAAAGLLPSEYPGRVIGPDMPVEPVTSRNLLYRADPDEQYAKRVGDWKLIYGPGDQRMAFDLATDPFELTDLSSEQSALLDAHEGTDELIERSTRDLEPTDEMSDAIDQIGYVGDE